MFHKGCFPVFSYWIEYNKWLIDVRKDLFHPLFLMRKLGTILKKSSLRGPLKFPLWVRAFRDPTRVKSLQPTCILHFLPFRELSGHMKCRFKLFRFLSQQICFLLDFFFYCLKTHYPFSHWDDLTYGVKFSRLLSLDLLVLNETPWR